MLTGAIDAILIRTWAHIICELFQLWDRIAHGDRKRGIPKHLAVIETVPEDDHLPLIPYIKKLR